MFRQCREEEEGWAGATGMARAQLRGAGAAFAFSLDQSSCSQKELITDSHSVGSLKQSKLRIWRKRGGKNDR